MFIFTTGNSVIATQWQPTNLSLIELHLLSPPSSPTDSPSRVVDRRTEKPPTGNPYLSLISSTITEQNNTVGAARSCHLNRYPSYCATCVHVPSHLWSQVESPLTIPARVDKNFLISGQESWIFTYISPIDFFVEISIGENSMVCKIEIEYNSFCI